MHSVKEMSTASISAARLRNLALPLVSFAVLAAVKAVQFFLVDGRIEQAVRFGASALGRAVVPVLIVLAFRDWLAKHRARLSPWRNGFALSSIVLLFAAWGLPFFIAVLAWIGAVRLPFQGGLEWIWLIVDCTLVGFALAFTLRGAARAHAISAALLSWAGVQAGIYI